MASISVRKSIRWLPDPASEPTSTTVLTSPGGRFVDIRILRRTPADGPGKDTAVLPASRIDWAFAGFSHSEMRDGTKHCVWRHFVDSRSVNPEEVTDEGDMVTREDGRDLETGRMVNPATGRETDYEEVWKDVDPTRGVGEIPGKATDPTMPPLMRYVVLQLQNDERKERGMVVCLGKYCQGVVRKGDAFTLERWNWHDHCWKMKYSIGSLWLPCDQAMLTPDLVLGSEVKGEEPGWSVVEIQDI